MSATILVVEDDAAVAETIREVLVAAGYHVPETAASGVRAIEAALRLRPALVLMDVQLEGPLDGIETASQLHDRTSARVIYITGMADDETLRRAKETAPLGYLKKPFNARELRVAVELALHQAGLEGALAAREQWFATTLRSIGDAVLTTDGEDRVTFLNRAAEAILGRRSPDVVGQRVDDVMRFVNARGEVLPALTGLPSARVSGLATLPRGARLVMTRPDAEPLKVEVEGSVAPIVLDATNAFGTVMVFRDVGECRELERRLGMTERLAAVGTMAAGMQHEINNPLASVVANLQFSLEALRATSSAALSPAQLVELMTALEEASEGAERVRRTVEELRHFSRGAAEVDAPIDVTVALDEAVRVTAHAVRHHASVRKEYGPTPRVRAEEGQLARVFMNIMLSAAHATGDGGAATHTIVLSTRTDARGRAVAEVRDDGPGLPQDMLHRIFDPFVVAQPHESQSAELGLGLAISHSIVTSLGGEIDVESEPGKGTTFRVSLPAAESTPAARPSRAPPKAVATPAEASARRGRVLVIDDELAIGKAIRRILSQEHEVTLESDARAALERLSRERFDVIFCDLMMPNMSGVDFFEALSARDAGQVQRVVFLTGGAFSRRSEEFLRDTRNVCLAKPFSREAVIAAAREMMSPPLSEP